MTTLTLIGKPDCHLCDVAHSVIDQVLADLPEAEAERVELEQLSILDDPELHGRWWEKIPVILLDGDLHAYWRVAPDRLREALVQAGERSVTR